MMLHLEQTSIYNVKVSVCACIDACMYLLLINFDMHRYTLACAYNRRKKVLIMYITCEHASIDVCACCMQLYITEVLLSSRLKNNCNNTFRFVY